MTQQNTHPATVFRQLLKQPGLIRGINIYDRLAIVRASSSVFGKTSTMSQPASAKSGLGKHGIK